MRFSFGLILLVIAASTIGAQTPEAAPAPPLSTIAWQLGPGTAKVGSQASIEFPEGYEFAPPDEARKFLEMTQNIPSGSELGILANKVKHWFVIFEFSDVGYVKDDEKKSLDADDMLKKMRENNDAGNEERRRRGWNTISLAGWSQPPHYDEATHNLEWGLNIKDDASGEVSVNYHTRYLGRRGYMSVELVAGAEDFQSTLAGFRRVMTKFAYTRDNDYRSFVRGDKVAEYGLSALVIGGAAAAAAKTGLFKGLWKLLLAGWKLVVACLAALGGAIKKLFRRNSEPSEAAPPLSTSDDAQ